jgi:hypothetical protein
MTLCFHIPLCWVLVFRSRFERLGAAVAIGISYWLNVIVLGLYMKYSSTCKNTLVPIYVPRNWGVFSLCYPFCYDDLVIAFISLFCKEKSFFALLPQHRVSLFIFTKSS